VLERLRPAEREIRELALQETDPHEAHRFEPVSRGAIFAVVALLAIGLAALPACLWRAIRPVASTEDD